MNKLISIWHNIPERLKWAILLLLIASCVIAFRALIFTEQVTSDPLVWVNIGGSIAEHNGTRAYVDYWDHKPPVLLGIYWFFYQISPDYQTSLWLSSTCFFVGATLLIVMIGRQLFSGYLLPCAFALLYILFASVELLDYRNAGWAPRYSLFFELLTIWLLIKSFAGNAKTLGAFALAGLAGASAVLATMCKQPSAVFVIMLGFYVIGVALMRQHYETLIGYVAGGFTMTVVIAVSIAAYLGFDLKLIDDFFYQLVTFNLFYADATPAFDVTKHFSGRHVMLMNTIGWAVFLPIIAGALMLARPRWSIEPTVSDRVFIHLHFFASALMIIPLLTRPYAHYYVALAPSLAFYTVYALSSSREIFRGGIVSKATAIALVFVSLHSVYQVYNGVKSKLVSNPKIYAGLAKGKEIIAAAIDLHGLANQNGYFQTGGLAFYLDFDLRPATRFIYDVPLNLEHDRRDQYLDQFAEQISQSQPAFLLIDGSPSEMRGTLDTDDYILAGKAFGKNIWLMPAVVSPES